MLETIHWPRNTLVMQSPFNHRIIKLGSFDFHLDYDSFVFCRFISSSRYLLSLSMEARGEYQQSVDVAATSVQLEEDSPIVPFNSIVRVL